MLRGIPILMYIEIQIDKLFTLVWVTLLPDRPSGQPHMS
jgi:hypothetical protein